MKNAIESLIYNLKNDPNNIDKKYDELAELFFNNFLIEANGNNYNLAEIEIYFATVKNDGDMRIPIEPLRDVFCHCEEKQGRMFEFYEHYSGYDITIGSLENGIMGGILIRGLESNDEFIYGPVRVYEKLKNQPKLLFSNNKSYFVNNSSKICPTSIIKTKRVNLSLEILHKEKFDNNSIRYFFRKARYIRIKSLNISRKNTEKCPQAIDDIIYELYCVPHDIS